MCFLWPSIVLELRLLAGRIVLVVFYDMLPITYYVLLRSCLLRLLAAELYLMQQLLRCCAQSLEENNAYHTLT